MNKKLLNREKLEEIGRTMRAILESPIILSFGM